MKLVKKCESPLEIKEGIPSKNMNKAIIHTACFLCTFNSSTAYVTGTSSRDMVEVSAAKDNNRKNKDPTILPITGPIL